MKSYRNSNWCMPFDSPAYPTVPPYYRDTLIQTVYFTAEKDKVAALLPKPLEPADSGLCCAMGIKVPFCSHWGPFNEVGVCVKVNFEGTEGFFLPCLFLTSSDAIAPGREVWGCPKKIADITVQQHGSELTTTAVRAGVQFMQTNSRCMEPAKPEEIPSLDPMYMLRIIPNVESNTAAIKQLVVNGGVENVKIHTLFKGPGVASFQPTVSGEFWRLEPREFVSSYYMLCDFTQGQAKIAYDYFKKD